ncbi:MAG: MEDS domain-containing protein [Thermoproteota archaeon]|nr:MEDS domain-containing protein [Thermoproteota archaeon]
MKDQPEINSSNDSNNHNPLKFLDTMDDYKHIVLFYEEPESGSMIQFRFIKNGLLKGQHCIYNTHEEDISLIENEMTKSGIDVEGYTKKNLLHIRKIPDPRNYQEGSVIGYDNIVKGILADLKQPSSFRMVSRAIPEVKNEEQISAELDVERSYHSTFGSFGGSLLCAIQVKKLNQGNRENG